MLKKLTKVLLISALTIGATAGVQVVQQPTTVQALPGTLPYYLAVGSQGYYVVVLQQALCRDGYPVSVDGYFGSETSNAVRAFQYSHRLAVDGIVGNVTWSAL